MSIIVSCFCIAIIAYLSLYIIYNYLLIIMAIAGRKKDQARKELKSSVQRQISIVIYAQYNLEAIIDLIKMIQKQDYPDNKYTINIILDNNSDNITRVLEHINGIRIWKITKQKESTEVYPSILRFIEKSMATEYTNAYVILSETDIIKPNFLERVNISLEANSISQACKAVKSPYASSYNTIGYINNRIMNRAYNAGNYHLGTGSQVLPSGLIVTQEFLEKHPVTLLPHESEIDYNFKLLDHKVTINWAPEVVIYNRIAESIEDLGFKKAENFIKSINAIINNFKSIIKSKSSLSLALYLLAPGKFVMFTLSFITLSILWVMSIKLQNPAITSAGMIIILVLMFLKLISDPIAMKVSNCKTQDYKIWLLGFLFYFNELFYSILYCLKLLKLNQSQKDKSFSLPAKSSLELHQADKTSTHNLIITDGAKNIKCEIIIEANRYKNQLTMLFKGKKFTSQIYENLDQAFEELNNKLQKHNFNIVCCHNCGYFSYSNKSYNESFGTDGHCFFGREGQQMHLDEIVKVWQVCENFCLKEYREQILLEWKNSVNIQTEN